MAKQIEISDLRSKSYRELLIEYVADLPDGRAVELTELAADMGLPAVALREAAKRAGLIFTAHVKGVAGGVKAMVANRNTVEAWEKANADLKRRKA